MSTLWSSPPTGTGCAPPPLRASRSLTWSPSEYRRLQVWLLGYDADQSSLAGPSLTSSSPTRSPTTTPRAPRPSPSLGPLTVRPSSPVFPTTPSESGPSYNSLRPPRGTKNDETVYDGQMERKGERGCAITCNAQRVFFLTMLARVSVSSLCIVF